MGGFRVISTDPANLLQLYSIDVSIVALTPSKNGKENRISNG